MYAVKLSTVPRRCTAVEVLGKGLELPRDARHQRRGVHVLDVLERADDHLVMFGTCRRDREAAVAGDDGGDAVVRRRAERRIPEDLRVVVRVDVDETRRDRATRRVELDLAAQVRVRSLGSRRPAIATSATRPGAPLPSKTVPPRMTRSVIVRHELLDRARRRTRGRAAVDRQHDPRDLRGPVAREVENGFGDVARRSHPLQRLHRAHDQRLVQRGVDRRRDVRRRDAVHADRVSRELDRGRLGEVDDGRLRGPIRHHARAQR